MAQVIKHKALSSNPSNAKKTEENENGYIIPNFKRLVIH
jgi:hypothetical protein